MARRLELRRNESTLERAAEGADAGQKRQVEQDGEAALEEAAAATSAFVAGISAQQASLQNRPAPATRRVQRVASGCATSAQGGQVASGSAAPARSHSQASVLLALAAGLLLALGRALGALLVQLLGRPARRSCALEPELERRQSSSAAPISAQRQAARRPAEIEMASRGVVAGFEEQEAANELSARLVAEALEAVGAKQQQQQGDEGASMPPSAQVPEIRASGAMAQTASVENSGEAEVAGAASSPAVAQGEIERLEREDARDSSGPEAEASGDELSSDNRSTPGGRRRDSSLASNYDDFCGQQASELNLRQLKMEALDDVLVCGRSRHATESARRLFSLLASSNGAQATTPAKLNASDSLSSRSSGHFDADDDDDEEEPDALEAHEELLALNGQPDDEVKQLDERGQSDAYDYGTIKLARRKRTGATSACSDVWSSDKNNNDNNDNDIDDNTQTSYGRTLVCSVSPVSSSSSRNSNAQLETLEGKGELLVLSERQFDTACYPIDGDEMRQCRAAFRENRRLIEQAQARALSRMQEAAGDGHGDAGDDEARLLTGSGALSRSSSRATERSHWADSLGRRARPIKCSHCAREIYPVERMELDFTRAKLNIHRNCFKCQVCSTLLRLETYASIDTKLYCPAHTRRAAPVAPRAAS